MLYKTLFIKTLSSSAVGTTWKMHQLVKRYLIQDCWKCCTVFQKNYLAVFCWPKAWTYQVWVRICNKQKKDRLINKLFYQTNFGFLHNERYWFSPRDCGELWLKNSFRDCSEFYREYKEPVAGTSHVFRASKSKTFEFTISQTWMMWVHCGVPPTWVLSRIATASAIQEDKAKQSRLWGCQKLFSILTKAFSWFVLI